MLLLAGCLVAFAQDQVQINTPYVSTAPAVVDEMLNLAKPKANDVLYDLGCGDGRIVIEAAKQYGARGVGIDNNPERIREAQENARREGVTHLVQFRIGDLYDADIENATIVALYLLPDVNLRLRPKLKSELKPGARIVSHTFGMGDWKPNKKQTVDGEKIYLWKIRRKFFFV
jgi:cyclopropane fatty-acyl-phospholipid synthase-like methyltransferase